LDFPFKDCETLAGGGAQERMSGAGGDGLAGVDRRAFCDFCGAAVENENYSRLWVDKCLT
jgi:hypothetical protein